MISVLVFLPALFALALLCVPRANASLLKGIALAGALGTFALSCVLLPVAPAGAAQEVSDWIHGAVGAAYHVRVDGISVWFVLLTTFLTVPAVWAAFSYRDLARLRGYLVLLLLFEWTLLGLFTAGDLLLFYIYWDLMLIPVFLALVAFADTPSARRAAWGYLIYNLAGGLVLLAGVIALVLHTHTFEVLNGSFPFTPVLQRWLFAAFALAFLIKTPVFPFHAWMPAAYTQSPSSLVAIISGVQSKAGLYGFIVFALPLFPDAAQYFAPAMLVLAVCSILYGALLAIAERNAKTLVAYSSLSHLGLVLLALFAFNFTSLPAGVLMIVSHGLIAAALFLLVGFIEERTGTNELAAFGGLAAVAPRLWVYMLIAGMAVLGLPGLSGFAGEFLILIGAWQTQPVYTSFALFTVVLAAVYALRLLQGTMHGPLRVPADVPPPRDLRPRELGLVAPLLVMIFFLGVWPAWLNDRVPAQNPAIGHTTALVQPR
ncbi:MAG: NADH-quinone oxidoreductase subunit M [Candidatus Eremiobacteraeota bacterium]|nr:NADH-quinone oxidoreductase subunit M [Candidatus Eremiobacteraeota bacterium]MBV8365101.1 NADH-quinone oxidoreductase subunit M [Candidatus Eremiobacteraeota bacterium]